MSQRECSSDVEDGLSASGVRHYGQVTGKKLTMDRKI